VLSASPADGGAASATESAGGAVLVGAVAPRTAAAATATDPTETGSAGATAPSPQLRAFARVWIAMLEPSAARRPTAAALLAMPYWRRESAAAPRVRHAGSKRPRVPAPAAPVAHYGDDDDDDDEEDGRDHQAALSEAAAARRRVAEELARQRRMAQQTRAVATATAAAVASGSAAPPPLPAADADVCVPAQLSALRCADRVAALRAIAEQSVALRLTGTEYYTVWVLDTWCAHAPVFAAGDRRAYNRTVAAALLWTGAFAFGCYLERHVAAWIGVAPLTLLAHLRNLVRVGGAFRAAVHRVELLATAP
jgi:hypothetical protein